jgi:amino acid transporter
MEAQGISRDSLPYKGWYQPYLAYYALVGCFTMAFVSGYTVFLPRNWDVPTFLFSYTMIGVFPVLYFGWKFIKKTELRKPEDVDLVSGVAEIEEYTRNFVEIPARYELFPFFFPSVPFPTSRSLIFGIETNS